MTVHRFDYVEISAWDPEMAAKFYNEIFGWKMEVDPNINYIQFVPEEGPGGGFPAVDDLVYKAGNVIVYINTDDMEGTLRQVEALGGRIIAPRTPINESSWFAFFADPTGNRLGLYTRNKPVH